MIEETGVVTSTEGVMAKILVQKRGYCDGCAAKGTCESTEDGMEIEAVNEANASVGQTVKVSMRAQTYLKGTMLVYGLPLILFIAAAIAGKNLGEQYFQDMNSDLIAALTGFSALVISLVVVKWWVKKTETSVEYKPVIEEIIS